MIGKHIRPDPDTTPNRAAECIAKAAYSSFYDLIAVALETGNPKQAITRLAEAGEYMGLADLNALRRELEADYYEFT